MGFSNTNEVLQKNDVVLFPFAIHKYALGRVSENIS